MSFRGVMEDNDDGLLDLEELTPSQLKKIVARLVRSRKPQHKRPEEERDEDNKKEDKAREDLADLHAEKGDSKPPKVTKEDLPEIEAEDDEEEDEGEASAKKEKTNG